MSGLDSLMVASPAKAQYEQHHQVQIDIVHTLSNAISLIDMREIIAFYAPKVRKLSAGKNFACSGKV